MITINPKPNLKFDPNNLKNPLGPFFPIGFGFQPPKSTPRNTYNPSNPLISKTIHTLSVSYQTADLQPEIYIQAKIPGPVDPALVSPQRGAALTSVKGLLIKKWPLNRCVRSNHKYSCITAYD